MQPMWLPALSRAVAAGDIDVAITCGIIPEPAGVIGEVFAAEPLLAGLRPGHRLAGQASVSMAGLAQDVLGRPRESLFPAWALSQQQALEQAGVHPHRSTWKTPIWPPLAGSTSLVSALQWNPDRVQTTAVTRFVHTALTADLPPGWLTQPGHLRHQDRTAAKP